MCAARAPMTSALEKLRACPGTVRRMGCSRLKHSTGAATLVIHMLAKEATNMLARMTHLGTQRGPILLNSSHYFTVSCIGQWGSGSVTPEVTLQTWKSDVSGCTGACC